MDFKAHCATVSYIVTLPWSLFNSPGRYEFLNQLITLIDCHSRTVH